jgi:histidinol-phosphate aminotransferase
VNARVPAATADPSAALARVRASVRQHPAYHVTPRAAARKLNQNESPWDLPAELKREVLARWEALPWNRYPELVPHHLVARIAARAGWVPEGTIVGCGSNDLLMGALLATVEAGAPVVAPVPSFGLYHIVTDLLGGRHVGVPLTERFAYDVDALLAATRREGAGVLILCAPNNPTGTPLPADAVARALAETEALVFCDEAYLEFGGGSALPLLPAHPRLVIFRTFSKALGLAGLRLGYALGHPALMAELAKARLPYNVNALTVAAVEAALDHEELLAERVRLVAAERERLTTALGALPGLETWPSLANFVLVRARGRGAELFRRLHAEHGILVRDVSTQPLLADCLRITVGTPDDTETLVDALRRILGGTR